MHEVQGRNFLNSFAIPSGHEIAVPRVYKLLVVLTYVTGVRTIQHLHHSKLEKSWSLYSSSNSGMDRLCVCCTEAVSLCMHVVPTRTLFATISFISAFLSYFSARNNKSKMYFIS